MRFSKSILTAITALLVLALAGFASAGVLDISSVSYSSTASHNSDVTVNFNVAYSGNLASSTISFAASTTNIGTWKTLPATTVIANNSVAVPFSAVLNIPQYATGTVSATLKVDGNASATDSESITISITNTPSLAVTSVQSLSKTQNATINVTNTGNVALSNIDLSPTGDIINVSFSADNFALSAGSSRLVNVNSFTDYTSLGPGAHYLNIQAKDVSTNATGTLTYTVANDFCDKGNVNSSKISITELEDKSSDNEWEWKPLDEVEIEFEVGNDLSDDEDFVVELALYDTVDDEFIELDGEDSLEQDVSIDEDDSATVTFEFQVPAEVEESEGRYILFVKAYVDGDEDAYCNSYSAVDAPDSSAEAIKIEKENNDVVLDELTVTESARPGDTITVSARAYNIGNEDEDKVKVILTNAKLGLSLESSSFDLDSGDSNLVDFSFVIPDTAESGVYALRLVSYFDYKKSSDSYSKDSDVFEVRFAVVGGSNASSSSSALSGITASLTSEAKAGSQMEITTTIKNLGSKEATFIVGVKDYESWAVLNSISDRIITLGAGASKDITITFDVDKEASGEQTFTIESRSGDKLDSKEVAVELGASSLFSSLASSLGSKPILWVIGIINVVLIVLIIYIAIRVFRR